MRFAQRIADVVAAEKRSVLERWRAAARATAPEKTAQLDDATLEDHLPMLIDEIACALRGEATADVEAEGMAHGRQRRRLGFSSAHCVGEIHLFRRILLDTLEQRPDVLDQVSWSELGAAQRTILHLIDRSIEASVLQYTSEAEGERDAAAAALEAKNHELEESHRQKDRFLALLAHELRNPLAPILAAVTVLQRKDGTPETRQRACEIIERQARHQARLVDDLLDVNRIAHGKIELERSLVDLRDVVRHALEACRPGVDARKQELDVRVPDERVPLLGDPTRLAQVVINLLGNASKFTPSAGSIALEVSAEAGEATVRVRDAGTGIAPDALPHVFELFLQGESTVRSSEGGLGVGLWLAKTLVEMHGGTIAASSAGVGKGAEFVVRLPLVAGERSRS